MHMSGMISFSGLPKRTMWGLRVAGAREREAPPNPYDEVPSHRNLTGNVVPLEGFQDPPVRFHVNLWEGNWLDPPKTYLC